MAYKQYFPSRKQKKSQKGQQNSMTSNQMSAPHSMTTPTEISQLQMREFDELFEYDRFHDNAQKMLFTSANEPVSEMQRMMSKSGMQPVAEVEKVFEKETPDGRGKERIRIRRCISFDNTSTQGKRLCIFHTSLY